MPCATVLHVTATERMTCRADVRIVVKRVCHSTIVRMADTPRAPSIRGTYHTIPSPSDNDTRHIPGESKTYPYGTAKNNKKQEIFKKICHFVA